MMVGAFLFCAHHSLAQLPTIKTSVDKNSILIGQQLDFRVETTMPANTYRLSWFSLPDSFGRFEVITKDKIDSTIANGNLNFSQAITLTNFDSGTRVIPPMTLTLESLDGDSTFKMFTDSISVEVSYSPLDSIQPFHDIKPIEEVNKEWPWWAWALLGLGVALLIFWIVFLVKFFRKKRNATELFTSKLSPFDEAMQSLSAIEKDRLIEKRKEKELHSRLTDIFKRFLSRETNTYKLHLTSDEILMELGVYDLSREQITEFANCLSMGNVVKFAQYIPPAYENEKCLTQTKEMITTINNLLNKTPGSDL